MLFVILNFSCYNQHKAPLNTWKRSSQLRLKILNFFQRISFGVEFYQLKRVQRKFYDSVFFTSKVLSLYLPLHYYQSIIKNNM